MSFVADVYVVLNDVVCMYICMYVIAGILFCTQYLSEINYDPFHM